MYFRNNRLQKMRLQMFQKSPLRRPFDKQHDRRSQTLFKFVRQQLYHIYWSLCQKLSQERLLLVICKILGLLVNTWTADDKYSLPNRGKLTQPIQTQLSKKQTTFPQFIAACLKFRSNLEHFEQKCDPHSLWIFGITDSKKSG